MDDRIDLRRMGSAIRRWWWFLVLLGILALFGAPILTEKLPVTFRARTSILVGEALVSTQVEKDDLEASQDLALILASLLRERPVLRGVIEELHLATTWTELSGRIRASVTEGNRNLVVVTVEAPSKDEAISIARQIPVQLKLFVFDDRTSYAASNVRAFTWERVGAAERHILNAEHAIDRMRALAHVEPAPAVQEGLSSEIGHTETIVTRWQQGQTITFGLLSKFASPGRLDVVEEATTQRLASDVFLVTGLTEASALVIGLVATFGLEARRRSWRALEPPSDPHQGRPPGVEVGAQVEKPRFDRGLSSPLDEVSNQAESREVLHRAGSAEESASRADAEAAIHPSDATEGQTAVPPLISIGGASRSGSTLLTLLLGRPEGFLPVGELRYVWSRGYNQNMLCGCGTPFRECEFWRSVLTRAYGSFDRTPANQLQALQTAISRIWHLPLLLAPTRAPEFNRRVERYVSHLARLCEALREVSGATCIVDSSKLPSYCYLLDRAIGHQGMLIHLVRDSRAVAFSFQRMKRKPDIHWKEDYMKRFSPAKSAADWNGLNLGMELIRAKHPRTSYVRYEDLVRDPLEEITRLAPSLALQDVSDLVGGGEVDLGVAHTVSGNPLRFATGKLAIRADSVWESQMKARDRRLVTAMTLPLLARYGYVAKGSSEGLAR